MSIKYDSRHLYLQVIDQIKKDIENGIYKERERLPSEYELSKQLGVSRATLREALRTLEEDNIVTRRHGVGTFVNPKPIFSSGIEQLHSITDMINHSGRKPGTQFLSTELIEPTDEEWTNFSPKNVSELVKIERVRTANGVPVVFCIDRAPKDLIPLEHVHEGDSLFKLLEQYADKRITYAISDIEPIGYNERIYEVLKCKPDQTLLLLKQMHYTAEEEPVLYSSNFFRSDMFSFQVLRKRI